MNPKISIAVDAKNKAVSTITGMVTVGAKIEVEITGLPSEIPDWASTDEWVGPSLRFRIVDPMGKDLVRFPLTEKTSSSATDGDQWQVVAATSTAAETYRTYNGTSTATVDFNTDLLRKAFADVPYNETLEFGVILDSIVDAAQYATGKIKVKQWAAASTEDPTVLPDWRDVVARIDAASASVTKSGTTATISITDTHGSTTTATVTDGTDGVSSSASVSKTGNAATITCTTGTTTTTAIVYDGDGIPSGGTANQVVAKNSDATETIWKTLTASDVGAAAISHSHAQSDVTGLADALSGKISNPSGGAIGNVLKKTSDGVEWAAETGGTITDVKVDGTSVVSSGVANIDLTGKLSTDKVITPDPTDTTSSAASAKMARGLLDRKVYKRDVTDWVAGTLPSGWTLSGTQPTFNASTGYSWWLYDFETEMAWEFTSDSTDEWAVNLTFSYGVLSFSATRTVSDVMQDGSKTLVDSTELAAKQNAITSSAKLSSDLVDDTNHTNKFVTAAEKSAIATNTTNIATNTTNIAARPMMTFLGDGVWQCTDTNYGYVIRNGAYTFLAASKTSFVTSEYSSDTTLTEVYAANVTSTQRSSFYQCTSLATVLLPAATAIGQTTFYNCTSLTTVLLPAVTSIAGSSFAGCTALTTISLPAVTEVAGLSFARCTSLTTISLPLATTIRNNAFNVNPDAASASDYKLTSINLASIASATVEANASTWGINPPSGATVTITCSDGTVEITGE